MSFSSLRIVALSDTHGRHRNLRVPDGDVLVHAGDLTAHGQLEELLDLNAWLGELPHRHKLVIAGNQDLCCEREPERIAELLSNATYLCDTPVELGGLRFYGSPWQPEFRQMAFNLPRGEPLRERWAMIPDGADVLITHTPPRGRRDRTFFGSHVGCADLREALGRVRPRLHVFGHIHEGAGVTRADGTTFVNASALNLLGLAGNQLRFFDLAPMVAML